MFRVEGKHRLEERYIDREYVRFLNYHVQFLVPASDGINNNNNNNNNKATRYLNHAVHDRKG